MATANTAPVILRRKQVEERTGLSRSTLYAKIRSNPKRPSDFDATFPRPVTLGARSVGWIESEVSAWLQAQAEKRGAV